MEYLLHRVDLTSESRLAFSLGPTHPAPRRFILRKQHRRRHLPKRGHESVESGAFSAVPNWLVKISAAARRNRETHTHPGVVCLPAHPVVTGFPSLSVTRVWSGGVVWRTMPRFVRWLVSVLLLLLFFLSPQPTQPLPASRKPQPPPSPGACRQGAKIKVRHLLQRSRKRRGMRPMGDARRGGPQQKATA